MRYRVQVYLDGLRDTTHRSDGEVQSAGAATVLMRDAVMDMAVSEVRVVKIADDGGFRKAEE